MLHLDPNSSYGVGNWIDPNDPPRIEDQQSLVTLEDESLTVGLQSLVISDPDVDPSYHVAYELTLYGGENYLQSENVVTPGANYTGLLTVPVTVSDGAADSQTFDLQIEVLPVNDAPVITGQNALETLERTAVTIFVQDVVIDDPDNEVAEMTLVVQDGAGYSRVDNTITPNAGILGDLAIGIVVSDGNLDSEIFQLQVVVKARPVTKSRSGGGSAGLLLIIILLLVGWSRFSRSPGRKITKNV